MAIYRGTGGSGEANDDATLNAVTEQAQNAATSASEAASSATAAASSATAAASSESSVAADASAAATSASNASTSETNAASSATAAASSASAASTSASNASTSETNASTSATSAASSATIATTKASEASTSATTATTKASEASTSATNAATSATNAGNSATAAASSATSAASSASAASASKDAALAALDSFDDRYLGQKTSDPTTDNDGDALVAGALYFNTTDDTMKVYEGSTWVSAYASLSGALIASNNLSDLNSVSAARTNLGLGTAATTASTDYATAAQGALADSALQSFTETNDLTTAVTWANVPDANITQTSVTQHQAALSITESQISDFGTYLTSYTETDPVYTASSWYATTNNSTNWNTAYGWGDHSTAGYLSAGDTAATLTVTTLTSTTANITTVDLGDWTITESSGVLYFATGGTNKMKLDASGNLTVTGDVTAYGTV